MLGLAAGDDVFDAIIEGGELVLARVASCPRAPQGLASLALLLLTWAAVLYAKVGVRRLPGATGSGLAGDDESAARERLRLAGLRLDEIAVRDRRNARSWIAGLGVRVIDAGDAPLVELSGGALSAPLLLHATGDPPERLVRVLRENGASVG